MQVLNDLFGKYGYRIYMCSLDQRFMSFVQEENYYVNVIGLFDERQQTSTQAQMQSFLDAHKGRLTYERPKDIHFLKLICTDARGVGRLVPGRDAHGLVETEEAQREAALTDGWVQNVWYLIDDTDAGGTNGRLFVPQAAPEDFYGLRAPLEQFVAAEGIRIAHPEINLSEAQRTQLSLDRAPAREGTDGQPVLKEQPVEKEAVCYVTLGLVLLNVTMFILQSFHIFEAGEYVLTDGILTKPREWYRLVTYMFLHGDLSHLLNNMLMLYAIGTTLERQFSRGIYGMIYFVSGISAGIFSVWYHTHIGQAYVSLGASGAIYGLMGAIMAFLLLRMRYQGRGLYRRIAIALFLLFYTSTVEVNVDYAAHLGGFVYGLLVCGICCMMKRRNTKFGNSSRG
ncbi:MAG: rhomboid family intramembrane serine protease [Lachnospiraceae bacterium]|nr:rhomboid family intramembrane serine protease [Lachnospiraceae bacterium]